MPSTCDSLVKCIARLCQHCDNLLSRATQVKRPLRRTLCNAANNIRFRIRHLVTEMHHNIAHFLVTNFDVIILPMFETKSMTKRGACRINKKSLRQMLPLSHDQFKTFLKQKANEYGVTIIDACKANTSKPVSWIGGLKNNLGGAQVIKDTEGNAKCRDLNGTRGIFIKNTRVLVVHPR